MNLFHFIAKLNFTAQSEASQGLEAISDIVLNSENLFQIADNDHWKSATVSEQQKCDSPCLRDQGKAASVYFYINYLGSETTNYLS